MVNVQKIVGSTVLNERCSRVNVRSLDSSVSRAGRGVGLFVPCCNFTRHSLGFSANTLPAVFLLIQPRRVLLSGIKALLGPQSEPTLCGLLAVLAQWLTERSVWTLCK